MIFCKGEIDLELQYVQSLYSVDIEYLHIFLITMYHRVPFSMAKYFTDFVDFGDFHKICFTEN